MGVDPDKERVKIANEKYGKSNLEFLEGDSENFPTNQYDIVYSNYVLQWIQDNLHTCICALPKKETHGGIRSVLWLSVTIDHSLSYEWVVPHFRPQLC